MHYCATFGILTHSKFPSALSLAHACCKGRDATEERQPSSEQNVEQQQAEQHQLWWQRNQRLLIIVGSVVIIVLIAFSLAVYKFGWDWTGFGPCTSPPHPKDTDYRPAKNLWDWLGLLAALAIPVVAGIGAAWFSGQLSKASDKRNELQHKVDRRMAEDQQREEALQGYLDKMSELLLHENLRQSKTDTEVRIVARTWTWTVLRLLDPGRRGILFRFLEESGLISIIDLSKADLSGADLRRASLSEANLSMTNLTRADLRLADLSKTNLSGATLRMANLKGINLAGADLTGVDLEGGFIRAEQLVQSKSHKGIIMPDESIHP